MGSVAMLNDKLVERATWDGECLVYRGWDIGHMRYQGTTVSGRNWLIHRLVWTILRGPIPPGMVVMHTCDRPQCCNPAHLRLGTIADNQADMKAKGRGTVKHSPARQKLRQEALDKPCPACGGPRRLSAGRVRCPRGACRGGQ